MQKVYEEIVVSLEIDGIKRYTGIAARPYGSSIEGREKSFDIGLYASEISSTRLQLIENFGLDVSEDDFDSYKGYGNYIKEIMMTELKTQRFAELADQGKYIGYRGFKY